MSLPKAAMPIVFVKVNKYLMFVMIGLMITLSFGLMTTAANAAIDVYEFDTPQQEAQYRGLIEEFRCPKCQNQNLAGSDSQISQDLKRKTYQMVMAGQTDAQIREYMYERYGDFISYRPPVRPSTWILWFLPPLALVLLIGWWLWRNAKFGRATPTVTTYNASSSEVSTADIMASELTEQESEKLKALLKEHGTDSHASSEQKKP